MTKKRYWVANLSDLVLATASSKDQAMSEAKRLANTRYETMRVWAVDGDQEQPETTVRPTP